MDAVHVCVFTIMYVQVTWDDDVMVLNGRNFDKMTQKIPHILVEVYAPWCGHCQKFEPIYRCELLQIEIK